MEHVFTFTPSQLITAILGVCGAISVVIVAITHIGTVIGKVRAPEVRQNDRIAELEHRLDELEKDCEWHKKRIAHVERGQTITQQAILALLSHGISGNAEDEMKRAQAELQKYLTEVAV